MQKEQVKMSEMSYKVHKSSKQWDAEYQKTVLKDPDSIAVPKGAVTEAMVKTDCQLFKVKF